MTKDKNFNQSFVFKSEEELDKRPTGKRPAARYDHGMVTIKNYVVIFGGRTLQASAPFVDSINLLRLDIMEWIQLKPTSKTIPLLISDFASTIIPSQLNSHMSKDFFDDFLIDCNENKIIKN